MRTINLRNVNYDYPEANDTDWGDAASDYASAVASAINDIAPTSDIIDTLVSGLVEDGTAHVIPFLTFDNTEVKAAIVNFMYYRTGGSQEQVFVGEMLVSYRSDLSAWHIASFGQGNGTVEFSIDTSGQVKYTADNLGSTTFKIRFRAMGLAL